MDAEWSVAAGRDDPVVAVPWQDEASGMQYIDLRTEPHRVDEICEAQKWPEIRQALVCLNAQTSPVWSAKCDAWRLSEEEKTLDFGPVSHGFGAYFDTFEHEMSAFCSLDACLAAVQALARAAAAIPTYDARTEFVLRPAELHGQAGFAVTIYIYGYGASEQQARANWASAIRSIVALAASRPHA